MNYSKGYKNFVNGRYLSEGVRVTAGILLPAFVMSYFNMLATGIVMAVGALCVSVCDNPGPVHHRRNGMLVCNVLIFMVAIIISIVAPSPVLLGITLTISCFIFSMLGVYGTRASAIGIAALLVMILNLQHILHGAQIINNALYILSGGVWYMLFSLLLYRIRPYRLIQQILGDLIRNTGGYLSSRAELYDKDKKYDTVFHAVIQYQVLVQEQQSLVSELLFKTRTILKETTNTGRVLVMIYLEITELFERLMNSYQDYSILHDYFDVTHILDEYKHLLLLMANELEEIGIAVKSGTVSKINFEVPGSITTTKAHYNDLRMNFMKPENINGFISLGRILENIQDLSERIAILHHYTTYDRKLKRNTAQKIDPEDFIFRQDIKPSLFFDNLSLNANIFRHSLRVSIAVLAGYIISLPLHIGHSYWILLTVIVILKPAYSLTKKRNKDRLIGTLCGIIMGVIFLYVIKNNTALLLIMILFMTASYIFLRTNYFISVLLMTPYLLIFFHLLYPNDFKVVLTDRLIDTAIGSAIAFATNLFFIPAWEHSTIKNYMVKILESNRAYYTVIASAFADHETLLPATFPHTRKNVLVSLANLSDAFTRMLSEPKWQQKGVENIHRFVVLSHTLTSYIATLSYYLQSVPLQYRAGDFLPVINETDLHLANAVFTLQHNPVKNIMRSQESLRILNDPADELMKKRQVELKEKRFETETKIALIKVKSVTDQFNYIYSLSEDFYKICIAIETE
ncbi:MAG: FUSC family protein [Chitinophagaceae bacterium]|nr:FUSC family protein [Chitinophagaceae bacterium]